MINKDNGGPAGAASGPESIGVAVCTADGTIQLMLRAVGPKGEIGEAMQVFKPSDPKYRGIVAHLGGIQPGQSKPIPPFA